MSNASNSLPRPNAIPWGVAVAVVSLILVGGGAFLWGQREISAEPVPNPAPMSADALFVMKAVPIPEMLISTPGPSSQVLVHSVTMTEEKGTRVVKIQVVPGGDEIIVDAATGRLMETRPGRPFVVPPGRMAAPFIPVM